jgi:hypothetical protein
MLLLSAGGDMSEFEMVEAAVLAAYPAVASVSVPD